MTTVYVIRHAEAEGNIYRRIQGWYDSRITELGMRQIKELEKRLEGIEFDAIYSSDRLRTMTTARAAYVPRGMELQTTPKLREMNFGVWEDVPWGEPERFDRDSMALFNSDPDLWRVEGGETMREVQARMLGIIKELAAKHDGGTIACFSHGAAIRVMLCAIMGVPSKEMSRIRHCDNTAIAILEVDGDDVKIVTMNDANHLGPEFTNYARQKWWKSKTGFDSSNLWYAPFDLTEGEAAYLAARRDTDSITFGDDTVYMPSALDDARRHASVNTLALAQVYMEGTPCGIVELDVERGTENGEGWIVFYYLLPEFRSQFLAVQLMGHAIHVLRDLGRDKLCVEIPVQNENAIGFFEHFGFVSEKTDNKTVKLVKDISI